MYQLFLVLKARKASPTANEILFASGKKPFDSSIHAEYIKKLEAQAAGIKEAFMRQQAKAVVCLYFLPDYSATKLCNRNLGTKKSLSALLSSG